MEIKDLILKWIGIITIMYWVGILLRYLFRNCSNSWKPKKEQSGIYYDFVNHDIFNVQKNYRNTIAAHNMENTYDILRGTFMTLGLISCIFLFAINFRKKANSKKLIFLAILTVILTYQIRQIF